MEDVLDAYHKPYDPREPLLGMDELSKQLLAHTRPRRPCRIGQVARTDYEYRRHGTRNVFVMTEPKAGKRWLQVTRRRGRQEFAVFMKDLADTLYPKARRIHVVLDNLNTHGEKSFLETFGARQGRRIWRRFKFHYTPKHASWLNVAENEISALQKQCLNRRISSARELQQEIHAWCRERNRQRIVIDWKFDKTKAKAKFPALYKKTYNLST